MRAMWRVDGCKSFNRLDLHYYQFFYQHVQPISDFEFYIAVYQGQRNLGLDLQSSLPQLIGETCFISVFKHSRSYG